MPIQSNNFTSESTPYFKRYVPFSLTDQQTEITSPLEMASNGTVPNATGQTLVTYYVGAESQLTDPVNGQPSDAGTSSMSITIKNIVNVILKVKVKCDTEFFTLNGKTFQSEEISLPPNQTTTFVVLLNKSYLNVSGTGEKSSIITLEVKNPAENGLIYTSTSVTKLQPTTIPTSVIVE